MKESKYSKVLSLSVFFSVVISAVCAPITGHLNTYFPYSSQLFLFTVLLVILFGGIYMLLQKEVLATIKSLKLYFLVFIVTFFVTTIKYINDLVNGKNITFFSAYAIPAFILYSIVLCYTLSRFANLCLWFLTAYSCSFCFLFLLFQNHFVEANNVFRSVGMYKGSTELGVYALISVFCALILITVNKNYIILNCILFGISAAAIFLSGSRGSILAAIIGLGLYFLFSIRHMILSENKKRLLCSFLVIILSTGAFIGVFLPSESDKRNSTRYDKLDFDYYEPNDNNDIVQPPEKDEIEDLITENKHQDLSSLLSRLLFGDSETSSYGNNLRLKIWAEYVDVIVRNPILGISLDLTQRPYIRDRQWDPHNTFFYLGSRYGVIALFLYVSWVIYMVISAIFKKKKTPFFIAALSMFAAILVNSCVQDLMNTSSLWIAIAFALFAKLPILQPDQMDKILFIRNYTGDGGIERQITNIASGLTKNGYKVFLFTNIDSPFSERLKQQGVSVFLARSHTIVGRGLEIRRLCRDNSIQLIQSHMWKESYYSRAAHFFDRRLIHIYRVHTYIDCSQISKKRKKAYHVLDKLTSAWVDKYISINTYNEKELIEKTHISKRKIVVVHNGVAPLRNSNELDYRQINRSSIGMIANLVERKGHDILIDGIHLLHEKGFFINAYIYGGVPGEGTDVEDTTIRNTMQDMVHHFNLEKQVVFCGQSPNVAEAIGGLSIIVLPSYSEGTPNCLLEAMSLKKIVLASTVGGIPEFIHDGINGFLHEPGSAESFANKLEMILTLDTKLLNTICEEGYKTWEEGYSVDNMINGLKAVYDELTVCRGERTVETCTSSL